LLFLLVGIYTIFFESGDLALNFTLDITIIR